MNAEKSNLRAQQCEERRRAILEVAGRHFLEAGFAETSMSAIAAACGGSKSTLWRHFSSKEALFYSYLDERVETFGVALDEALLASGGTAAAMTQFGIIFLMRISSPEGRALRHMLSSEARRFPDLAQAYYERGPARVLARLTRYIAFEMNSGRLRMGKAEVAARQFLALCQAGEFADETWNRQNNTHSQADIKNDIERAIEGFLRMWLPDGALSQSYGPI